MPIDFNSSSQLRIEFPIEESYEALPIYALKAALADHETNRTASMLIKALRMAGYITIGDIINSSWIDIKNSRGIGKTKCHLLKVSLLNISANPEQLNIDKIEQNRRLNDIKKKMRNMGMIK
ncbi:hypothetical protein [Paenibacillus sp. FSL K6-2524]|uniref:hypothetical protein n=1 Tax=Paenibacillus sp. FSL K6-2524 TaxID=2954516 RepID=UPI0030FC54F1